MGILAMVSDFRGPNWFLSGETLNLLSRRRVQYEALDRRLALSGPVTNLKAVLWTDDDLPTAEQNRNLLELVEQGGLAIAPKYWAPRASFRGTSIGCPVMTFTIWAKAES